MDLKLLESELMKLSPKEKAVIAYKLLKELESSESNEIIDAWIDEAAERYKQIENGESNLIDGDLVLREAKSKYW